MDINKWQILRPSLALATFDQMLLGNQPQRGWWCEATRVWMIFIIMSYANEMMGGVVFEGPLYSTVLGTNRMVRVYLPPSYGQNSRKHYPVLYVHDGQNAFSTVGTNVAFGWGSWDLDRTVDRLTAEKKMQEIIMVSVDATRDRITEYSGPSVTGYNAIYENYKRFLIEELKPKIDREYRTTPGSTHTGVMGSSMGGICSLALAWDRPDVFGLSASLSGAYQIQKGYFLTNVLAKFEGKRKSFRVYVDSGVVDYTGGDDGRRNSDAVVAQLTRIGWKQDVNLLHFVDATPQNETQLSAIGLRKDKWSEAQRSQHNEFYWRIRAWRPLTFLYPPR